VKEEEKEEEEEEDDIGGFSNDGTNDGTGKFKYELLLGRIDTEYEGAVDKLVNL
jgi:hypothetical protein